jgi:hypothetical protein
MPSPVLEMLDFFEEIINGGAKCRENVTVLCVYVFFTSFVLLVWSHMSDKDFSFIMTLAGALQTIAFFLLLHKLRAAKSAAGVSSKTLQVYALMLMCRLTSTMVKNGYLPVDSTGDWLYQAADIASLIVVFQVLYTVHKRFPQTYQEEQDSMPIWNLVPGCILLGICLHGHLNHSFVFDTVWATAMYLDAIAMLPQLWMCGSRGEVDALAAHYVALMFLSRALTWSFWYTGFPELAPADGGFNKVGWIIMGAHSVQLLMSADFMYHYFTWAGAIMVCGPCIKRDGRVLPRTMVLPVTQEI